MSIKKVHDVQPEKFEFSKENLLIINNILKKYPSTNKKSAVMPLLYIAQKQNNNWIPLAALKYIGKFLEMPYISVYEIATFYTMYNLAPVGKYFVQVCTTSPCLLRGAGEIVKACQKTISKNQNEVSRNGLCSWIEVECLGACVNAPMIQVNSDYYEDLDINSAEKIFESFLKDDPLKPGSFRNRKSSAPETNKINGTKNA
jgi:NADH-quinone oxidoreductase E subunit